MKETNQKKNLADDIGKRITTIKKEINEYAKNNPHYYPLPDVPTDDRDRNKPA